MYSYSQTIAILVYRQKEAGYVGIIWEQGCRGLSSKAGRGVPLSDDLVTCKVI